MTTDDAAMGREQLRCVVAAQLRFAEGMDGGAILTVLLEGAVEASNSECGFVGEVLSDDAGQFVVSCAAVDHIRQGIGALPRPGAELRDLDNLLGKSIGERRSVTRDHSADDGQRGILYPAGVGGKPCLVIPLFAHGEVVGVLALGGRSAGYPQQLVQELEPVALACTGIIYTLQCERMRDKALRTLRESELRGRSIIENAVDAIVTINGDGLIESCNAATSHLFGYSAEELVGNNVSVIMPASHQAAHDGYLRRYLHGQEPRIIGKGREVPGVRKDGEKVTVELAVNRVELDGRILFVGVMRDITARKADELKLQRLNQEFSSRVDALDALNNQNALLAELGSFLQACQSEQEVFACARAFVGRCVPECSGALFVLTDDGTLDARAHFGEWGPEGLAFHRNECWALRRAEAHVQTAESVALQCRHISSALGEGAPVEAVCMPILTTDGPVGLLTVHRRVGDSVGLQTARVLTLLHSIAERVGASLANVRLRARLEEDSVRDPLTRLHNRRYITGFLQRSLAQARSAGSSLAVVMIDIDHFKRVNDEHGHDFGDETLIAVARALTREIRSDDAVCRLGGEEFLAVLRDCDRVGAVAFADGLRRRITNMRLTAAQGRSVRVTVSAGVAVFPDDGAELESLLKASDEMLYRAKREGRNRTASGQPENWAAKKVLLVDDDPDVIGAVEHLLHGLDASVRGFTSAEAALQLLCMEQFDLVLTDICMPGMDGPQLLAAVNKLPAPRPSLVFMTGYGGDADHDALLASGALQVLPKPLSRNSLLGLL